MSDDPLRILDAADVQCDEVLVYEQDAFARRRPSEFRHADAAILALARMVVEYKSERDLLRANVVWCADCPLVAGQQTERARSTTGSSHGSTSSGREKAA